MGETYTNLLLEHLIHKFDYEVQEKHSKNEKSGSKRLKLANCADWFVLKKITFVLIANP